MGGKEGEKKDLLLLLCSSPSLFPSMSCTECLTWESWGPGVASGTGMGWLLSTTACHLHMTSSGRLGCS